MNYRKILAICLPIIVTCSIVGVGFSSWFFGHEDLKTDAKNISITTTSAVDKGTLSIVSAPSKIVFSEGKGDVENLKDGIDFYQKTSTSSSYYTNNDKIVVKYSLKDKNDSIKEGNYRLFISFTGNTISIDTSGSTDFSTDSTDSSESTDSSSSSGTDTSSETSSFTDSSDSTKTTITTFLKLSDDYQTCSTTDGYDYSSYFVDKTSSTSDEDSLGYYEYTLELSKVIEFSSVDVKPTTINKYNSLKTALTNMSININFTCDLKEKVCQSFLEK